MSSLKIAMILVIVYYYILLTLEEVVGANTSECTKSDILTWASSTNYTQDGGATFYFDCNLFQVCRIRIDADFTLWNVLRPNLTLSENGGILNEIALRQLSSNDKKNNANDLWLNYKAEHLFNCSNCSVSVKFGHKNVSASKIVKRIAIKTVALANCVHPTEERVVKSPQLYVGVGALGLIIIGLFILMLIIIRKIRGDNKPSEASTSQAGNGLDEPTYATIMDEFQGDGNEVPEYATCQPYRNQCEEWYVYTSATSRPNRPRKEDNEGIYSQVEIVNSTPKKITKTTLEKAVYAKPNKKRAKESSTAGEFILTY